MTAETIIKLNAEATDARLEARKANAKVATALNRLLDAQLTLDATSDDWLASPEAAEKHVEAGARFQERHAAWNAAESKAHDLRKAARKAAKAARDARAGKEVAA